jgi:hypothetical protein
MTPDKSQLDLDSLEEMFKDSKENGGGVLSPIEREFNLNSKKQSVDPQEIFEELTANIENMQRNEEQIRLKLRNIQFSPPNVFIYSFHISMKFYLLFIKEKSMKKSILNLKEVDIKMAINKQTPRDSSFKYEGFCVYLFVGILESMMI